MKRLPGLPQVAAALTLALLTTGTLAGPGHDHGDDTPAAAQGTSLPRFVAASELFELVGVIDGRRLTVYLDHAATNEPVKDAQLELDIGGVKVLLQPHAEGEFEAELAQALPPGVHPVTATVSTAKDGDLLAAEIDLHEDASTTPAPAPTDWRRVASWGGGGVFTLLLLGLALRALLRRGKAKTSFGSLA